MSMFKKYEIESLLIKYESVLKEFSDKASQLHSMDNDPNDLNELNDLKHAQKKHMSKTPKKS